MNQFNLADNLIRLRHKKGITQEKLADFLGVSKASVSKWETGQSLPDIVQLPRLASFYDVTIDDMMGYEAQLSMKEVKDYYLKFSERFTTCEFEEVLGELRDFIRMYYSCDIAILQMVMLLMNHLMLANPNQQATLLEEMIGLCEHIQEKSEDVNVSNSAALFQANLELTRGNPTVAIQKLEHRKNPMNLSGGSDVLLVGAYQAAGQLEEATEWNQMAIFSSVLDLLQNSIAYLMNHLQEKEVAKVTIERISMVVDAYDLRHLHANTYLQFVYAKAMYFAIWGMHKEALQELALFVSDAIEFLTNDAKLHGDAYFDKLDDYFSKMEEYFVFPRNPQTVMASLSQQLMHPVFASLYETEEFQGLLQMLK